jgi:hypothetical protein
VAAVLDPIHLVRHSGEVSRCYAQLKVPGPKFSCFFIIRSAESILRLYKRGPGRAAELGTVGRYEFPTIGNRAVT